MTSLQNLVSPRFSTSASSGSSGKWSNQTKLQKFATVTIIAIIRSWYIALAPTTLGHQRARIKITEDLHSRQILELSTKDIHKATSEAELRTEAVGMAEARIQ
jgi:hypothetical protein